MVQIGDDGGLAEIVKSGIGNLKSKKSILRRLRFRILDARLLISRFPRLAVEM
jgi:hypothetical protein